MMDRFYRDEVRLVEVSDSILSPVGITPTIYPDRQPSVSGVHIDCRVVDHSAVGTIRVIGERESAAVEEVLTVAEDGFSPVTVKKFDTIDRFEITGLTGGIMSAHQVRGQGEPILAEVFLGTIWGNVVAKSGQLRAMEAGQAEQSKYQIATDDNADLKVFPNRYLYVTQGQQAGRKFRLTFITPPGRIGNVLGDLQLEE